VTVSTSPPPSDVLAYLTIYFDTTGAMFTARIPDRDGNGTIDVDDLQFWGVTNFIDPRNFTLSGRAVISVDALMADGVFGALPSAQFGLVVGNAVTHHVGLLSGLRETNQAVGERDDVMTAYPDEAGNAGLIFTTAPLAAGTGQTAIGTQDGEQLLLELFGSN
jgi:hypothetical protein